MHKVIFPVLFGLLALASALAGASEATVKAALQKKYPDIAVEGVKIGRAHV